MLRQSDATPRNQLENKARIYRDNNIPEKTAALHDASGVCLFFIVATSY
jgi:hypothetical protein